MKLNIPLIVQKKKSKECGLACLAMVLAFYNAGETITKLRKQIQVYPGIGVFMPQLGCHLLEQGFDVEIISMNPHIVTYHTTKMSQTNLLHHFAILSKKMTNIRHKTCLEYFAKFIELGGNFNASIPSKEDIKKGIAQNSPIITIMTPNFLGSSLPGFSFHFNVISGIDKEYIYINDPMDNGFGGQKKIPIDTYMYSIYSTAQGDLDNASLLIIKKHA